MDPDNPFNSKPNKLYRYPMLRNEDPRHSAKVAMTYSADKNMALTLSGEDLLQLSRLEHPVLGRRPDTVELAIMLGVHESQIANAVRKSRDNERAERRTETPRNSKRLAHLRLKLIADRNSREPPPITLPRLTFMEREI